MPANNLIKHMNQEAEPDSPYTRVNGERDGFRAFTYPSDSLGRDVEFHAAFDDNPDQEPYAVVTFLHGNNGSPYGATNTLRMLQENTAVARAAIPEHNIPPIIWMAPCGLDSAELDYDCADTVSTHAWVDKTATTCDYLKDLGRPECCFKPLDNLVNELIPMMVAELTSDGYTVLGAEFWTVIGHSMGGRAIHLLFSEERFHSTRFGGYISLAGGVKANVNAIDPWVTVYPGAQLHNANGTGTEPYVCIFGDSDCAEKGICPPGSPGNHLDTSIEYFARYDELLDTFKLIIKPGFGHNVIDLINSEIDVVMEIIVATAAGRSPVLEDEEEETLAVGPGYYEDDEDGGYHLRITNPELIDAFLQWVNN